MNSNNCPHPDCNGRGTVCIAKPSALHHLDGSITARYEDCPVCNGWEPKSWYLCACGATGYRRYDKRGIKTRRAFCNECWDKIAHV